MFFIRDCNGAIVGNLKGYRTMRGAQAQAANHRSSVYKAIWNAFDAQNSLDPIARICIFSIRLNEE